MWRGRGLYSTSGSTCSERGRHPGAQRPRHAQGDDMSPSASVHSAIEPAETPLTPESWGKLGMWIFLAGDAVGFGVLLASYGGVPGTGARRPEPSHRLRVKPNAAVDLLPVFSSGTKGLAVQ